MSEDTDPIVVYAVVSHPIEVHWITRRGSEVVVQTVTYASAVSDNHVPVVRMP